MQCNGVGGKVGEGKGLRSATLSSTQCHPVPFSGPSPPFSGPTYRNQQCDTISFLHAITPLICHCLDGRGEEEEEDARLAPSQIE